MDPMQRFKDNKNGVITDSAEKKGWLPKDARQDLGKWVNWEEAQSYARLMNQIYAGGFSDWRLPTRDELMSFYDEGYSQSDFEEDTVHIHPVFVNKCAYYMWSSDLDDKGQAFRINLRDGTTGYVDKSIRDLQAARLVRDMK